MVDVYEVNNGNSGVLNKDDTRINPSTEEKQDDLIAAIAGGVTMQTCPVNAENGGYRTLVADPGSGKKILVYHITGTNSAAGTVTFADGDETALSGAMWFNLNGGLSVCSSNVAIPLLICTANKAFTVSASAGTFKGMLTYAVVDA